MTATLTLRTETVGLRPEFDHVRFSERRAIRTKPEALSPRAREVYPRRLRIVTLSWKRATDATRILVRKLFADAQGSVLRFNFTPCDGTDADAFEVQIVPGSLKMRRLSPMDSAGRHEIEFDVEECR